MRARFATTATSGGTRLWQLDALRGLMLVLMTLSHVPTRLTQPLGQPFGFVSAAFGFVFISAILVGRVYGRRVLAGGVPTVRRALCHRAAVVYSSHLALLAILFGILPHTGLVEGNGPLLGMLWFFNGERTVAVLGAVGLLHQPGLLDILPMYVIFLLGSALVLPYGARRGWSGILALSTLVWLAAQFGLGGHAYDALVAATGLPVPRTALGAFDLLAWQWVWVIGMAVGWALATGWRPQAQRWPRTLIAAAACVALAGFAWRHGVGPTAFPDLQGWAPYFDKWHMGPLRALNAAALVVLAMRFGPRGAVPAPGWAPLQWLGRAALPVFVAHAIVVMVILGIAGDEIGDRAYTIDVAVLTLTFSVLFLVAGIARLVPGTSVPGMRRAASAA